MNVQEFILRNDELLPPGNIQATSEDSNNNPATGFTDTTSAPWCTAEEEGTSENYVELTFTEQVVAEFLESTGLLNSWVSNFSIQYSQSESGEDFKTYGVLENPQVCIFVCVCVHLFNKDTKATKLLQCNMRWKHWPSMLVVSEILQLYQLTKSVF